MRLAFCAGLSFTSLSTSNGATAALPAPSHWIWAGPSRAPGQTALLRKTIKIARRPRRAEIRAVADFCRMTVYLNGQVIADAESFSRPLRVDVADSLLVGKENVLVVRCVAGKGPAAFCLRLDVTDENERIASTISDTSWSATLAAQPAAWRSPGFAARGWNKAVSFGPVDEIAWGMSRREARLTTRITALDDYTQWKQALGGAKATDPATFRTAPGFQVELLHAARKNEGSWVSMAIDRRGRVLIGREDRGVLRMTLPVGGKGEMRVETINDTLLECRGCCRWATICTPTRTTPRVFTVCATRPATVNTTR